MMRIRPAAATAFFVVALTVSAFAEDQVDLRFQEGLKFADAGDFEEARQAFVQAYALHPTQPTLWNLAIAEMRVGRLADALHHLRTYRNRSPQDPEYTRLLPDLVIKLESSTGQVRVSAPSGAEIFMDGARWPERSPLAETVPVMPGSHVVESRVGATSKHLEFAVKVGETVHAELKSDAPSAARPSLPPGSAPTAAAPSYIGPLALGTAGLIGLGVGVGFGAASRARASDADALARPGVCVTLASPECQAFDEARSSANRNGSISIVGYIAGGAMLGGAALWAILLRGSTAQGAEVRAADSSIRIFPALSSSRAGLWAERSF